MKRLICALLCLMLLLSFAAAAENEAGLYRVNDSYFTKLGSALFSMVPEEQSALVGGILDLMKGNCYMAFTEDGCVRFPVGLGRLDELLSRVMKLAGAEMDSLTLLWSEDGGKLQFYLQMDGQAQSLESDYAIFEDKLLLNMPGLPLLLTALDGQSDIVGRWAVDFEFLKPMLSAAAQSEAAALNSLMSFIRFYIGFNKDGTLDVGAQADYGTYAGGVIEPGEALVTYTTEMQTAAGLREQPINDFKMRYVLNGDTLVLSFQVYTNGTAENNTMVLTRVN